MNTRSRNIKRFYYLLHSLGSKDFTYYMNDELANTITTIHYIGGNTQVDVPTSIDGSALNELGPFTFCANTTLTDVTISNSIESID